jgi:hypothetical protein
MKGTDQRDRISIFRRGVGLPQRREVVTQQVTRIDRLDGAHGGRAQTPRRR